MFYLYYYSFTFLYYIYILNYILYYMFITFILLFIFVVLYFIIYLSFISRYIAYIFLYILQEVDPPQEGDTVPQKPDSIQPQAENPIILQRGVTELHAAAAQWPEPSLQLPGQRADVRAQRRCSWTVSGTADALRSDA